MAQLEVKKCEVCGKDCVPINVQSYPETSEWHCPIDNKSYPMNREVADYFNDMERRSQRRRA